jgi:predicted kinase
VARQRLEGRRDEPGEASDGRWELYHRQKHDFEPLAAPLETWEVVDTSRPVAESVDHILRNLGVL